jgi:hypothetical protein
MDNKEILDALAKIPELVKAAETFKRTTEKAIATLAEAVKQRPQAMISESELDKLSERISKTKCAPPDTTLISRELSRRLSCDISDAIGLVIKNKAAVALKNASVTVEHSHVVERDLKDVVDKRMRHKILMLWIIIIVLLEAIGISAFNYYCSDIFWGKQFKELYTSKYITQDEKARIERNAGYTGILPKGYHKNPGAAQARLQLSMEILKKREKEAKMNNGKFSTEEEIQF